MAFPVRVLPPSARNIALKLIGGVLTRGQSLETALEAAGGVQLDTRDRAFSRLLATTVLRRRGQIDDAIARCLEKPLTPKARTVADILRLGAAQLLFLGTPPHAAVGETVSLATGRERPYASLINAVLRRLAREGDTIVAGQDAAWLNTPEWLRQSWIEAYGEATTRAIAAIHASEPPLDISVNADAAGWAQRLDAEILPNGSLRRRAGGAVTDLPGYGEGGWWVQDAAAALPARLFGDVRGRTIIDLCAAPGGKSAQLAAAGARVIAVDRSPGRIKRLQHNLARLRLSVDTVVADATKWRPAERVDGILLDAPCSATGTIRRHPDIPHIKTAVDMVRLQPVQDALLDAAVGMLAPGGTLVYCVCSLQPEEGPQRIVAALARHAGLVRDVISTADVSVVPPEWIAGGDLRTLPSYWTDRGGIDGFFAARVKVH